MDWASTDLPNQTDENSDNLKYKPHANSWQYISMQKLDFFYMFVSDWSEDEKVEHVSVSGILQENQDSNDITVKTYIETRTKELKASEEILTQAAEQQDDVSYSTVRHHVNLITTLASLPEKNGECIQKNIENVKKALELFKRLKKPTEFVNLRLRHLHCVLVIQHHLHCYKESNFDLLWEIDIESNNLTKVVLITEEKLEECCKWMELSEDDVQLGKIVYLWMDVLIRYFFFMNAKTTDAHSITEIVMNHLGLMFQMPSPNRDKIIFSLVYWALEITYLSIQRRALAQAEYAISFARIIWKDCALNQGHLKDELTYCDAGIKAAYIRLNVQWMKQYVAEKITGAPEKMWNKDIIGIDDAETAAEIISEVRTQPIENASEFIKLLTTTEKFYKDFLEVDFDNESFRMECKADIEEARELSRFLKVTKRSSLGLEFESTQIEVYIETTEENERIP